MLYTKLDIQDLKKVDYKVDMNIVKFNAILTIFGYVVLTLTLFAHGKNSYELIFELFNYSI